MLHLFFEFFCLGSSCWGISGYVLAFILDLGISVLLSFGPCKAFLMLSWGMLHLGYAGLTWGSRWAIFTPCWVVAASVPLSPIHINTPYQSINIKQSCTLVAHDVSSASPVPTIDKVNKCKSHPKNERQPKRLCIFQGKGGFSCALSIWLHGWRFYANASASSGSSGSRKAKVQITSI